MISVTSVQINAWLALFIWPFFRVLAILQAEPIFGHRSIPARVKIGLAAFITIILAPTLGPMPNVEPGSAAGLVILMQQVLIGLAIGLTMRVVFTAIEMAGNLAGLQMGLGFATFFDPQNSAQTPVVSQFIGLLAILVFLSLNGHLMVLTALAQTFRELPITAQPASALGWQQLTLWGREIFLAGTVLCLPVLAAMLITNLAIGIMTRAAPQLNIFAVGFPVTLAVGFVVLALSLPYLAPLFERLIGDGIRTMVSIAHALRPAAP